MKKLRRIVNISSELYEQIQAIAQQQQRSASAQMVYFLQEGVDRYRQTAKAEEKTHLIHGG